MAPLTPVSFGRHYLGLKFFGVEPHYRICDVLHLVVEKARSI